MDIVDIIIRATGQLADWLTDSVDIVIKAVPQFASWLSDSVDIVLKATPGTGGIPPIVFLAGGLLVLFGGWQLMNDKER